MIYAVRVKIDEVRDWLYANESLLISRKELEQEKHARLKDFFLDKDLARKLYVSLLTRQDLPVKAVALVQLSHYEPYSEYEVEMYQERK